MYLFINIAFYIAFIGLALDHLITGLVATFFTSTAKRWFHGLYGLALPNNGYIDLLLKPWGSLGAFTGLVGLVVLSDIGRYKLFLLLFVGLLALRLVYRLRFAEQGVSELGLSAGRNRAHSLLIFICAALFVWKYTALGLRAQ